MKTFSSFTQLDERAFSPRGQAAREKMRAQNQQNRDKKELLQKGQEATRDTREKGGALAVIPKMAGQITKHSSQVDKDKVREREVNKQAGRQAVASGSAGEVRQPTEYEKEQERIRARRDDPDAQAKEKADADKERRERRSKRFKRVQDIAGGAYNAAKAADGAYKREGPGVSQGQDMQGLSGRDKGLIS